ncbi:putative BEL1-like homeodomain protein 1 [Iris pallida]|uniref:BEL1-like homeodomain protein 1 n=1 Tax=Iris pallida TaxID=29817 RepID=A0AAX6H5T7_IRIPA|nr:putative BEL1-like homeodomain protein 1 [Iris pallida]
MSTYFHGAQEIQGEGLQTLYLMNPSYVGGGGYSDSPGQANMVFLNQPMSSLNPVSLSPNPHHPQHQQQHFVGIPLQAPTTDPGRPPPIQATTQDLSAIHQGLSPRLHYNLWTPTPSNGSVRPTQQGLSLSLSPQQAPFAGANGDEAKIVGSSSFPSASAVAPSGVIGVQSVLMGSKYLKAAQQLLDEVVNVGKGEATSIKGNDITKNATKGDRDAEGVAGEGSDSGTKRGAELTAVERQELQMKKAKLVNMLDEVEQRYRQYHHQMQIVVSSFDAVAGMGSARTYTALALQTISRQFRCLRDAISGQIRATSKSLGEEDCLGGGSNSVGSRLRFVDHHLRQQRALQQLGMIQNNAWRPQRGLPERAVSVLRAWLFEHFLHPYPKDSDKHMLAKQTGLTRSQVSNWFINARVRLWKPMVEEMYNEETKEQEQNNRDDKTSKSEGSDHSASRSTSHPGQSPTRTDQTDSFKPNQDNHHHHNDASLPPVTFHSSNLGIFDDRNDYLLMQQRLKKARMDESLHHQANVASADDMSNRELLMKFMDHHGGGFGAYPLGELGRFDHEQFAQPRYGGNGVSLTLGLPHCENLSLSGSQQPSYLSNESIPMGRRLDMGSEENDYNFSLNNHGNNPSASHPPPPPNAYDHSINIQNRKRFAAQLLPDFVT